MISCPQKKFYAFCISAIAAGVVIDVGMHVLNLILTPSNPPWQFLYKAGLFGVSGCALGGVYRGLTECTDAQAARNNQSLTLNV